ncbi:MAG: kinase-like domain-containing protein, partial [Linnemannia elongata]
GVYRNLPVFIRRIGGSKVNLTRKLRIEIMDVMELRHPKLVELVGVCLQPPDICIVYEHCSKGTLTEVLANPDLNLNWLFKLSFMSDISRGMEFLQNSKIQCHGDLRSSNCLVTSRWEVKVGGYGLLELMETQRTGYGRSIQAGLWAAPENMIHRGRIYHKVATKSGDVFSAGIVFNEIMTRTSPYER